MYALLQRESLSSNSGEGWGGGLFVAYVSLTVHHFTDFCLDIDRKRSLPCKSGASRQTSEIKTWRWRILARRHSGPICRP